MRVSPFAESVRFVEPATYWLTQVDAQLIRPLLDRVSAPDSDGKEVIEYPEHGWLQLKERLLRDLSRSDQVLPVQLALALGSLRRLPTLTVREYAKHGGARGLERLYIERQVRDAAKVAGMSERALLRGLMCLVSKDGTKTQRATQQAFAAAVGDGQAVIGRLELAIEHLERWRVVRRQVAEGKDSLVLHHDYLALGVREAVRYANRWTELVRERAQEFREALGLRAKWAALLSLRLQARLLWERLRGRFAYGEHRGLAWWSALRLMPVVSLAVMIGLGVWWQERNEQEHLAARIMAGVGHTDPAYDGSYTLTREEAHLWRELRSSSEYTKQHLLRLMFSDPAKAERAGRRVHQLAHVLVGLDATGEHSRNLVRSYVLPVLTSHSYVELHVLALRLAATLRLDVAERTFISSVAANIIENQETTINAILYLVEGLKALAGKLEADNAQVLAKALIERMAKETDSNILAGMAGGVRGLVDKLEASDVQVLAKVLVERVVKETDILALRNLADVLGTLEGKLEASDAQVLAKVLVERMVEETDSNALEALAVGLGGLVSKLETGEAQVLAKALVERMVKETDSDALGYLARGLSRLAGKLESRDVQPGAKALVERMVEETDRHTLAYIGSGLGGLASQLEAGDAQVLAKALVERMVKETDSDALGYLARGLGRLAGKLESRDVQPGAKALVERMVEETDMRVLRQLADLLGELAGKLEASDAQVLAKALVERMVKEADGSILAGLAEGLGHVCKTTAQPDRGVVAALRCSRTPRTLRSGARHFLRSGLLATFCKHALGGLAGKLEAGDAQVLAKALVERMVEEVDSQALAWFAWGLGRLAVKLEAGEAQVLVKVLVEQIAKETEGYALAGLAGGLGELAGKLEAGDAQVLANVLFERMVKETDNFAVAGLAQALGMLAPKLKPVDIRKNMVFLAKRLEVEHEHGDELARGWVQLQAALPASEQREVIQAYVDLLALPLSVYETREELLKGLEALTGETFNNDIWQFVDWATGDEGRALGLRL